MEYEHIRVMEDACAVPEDQWLLVCKRSSDVPQKECVLSIKQQEGCFVSTGAIVVQIKEVKPIHYIYWVTLILPDGGEHHAPLGLYFDILLVPKNTVS